MEPPGGRQKRQAGHVALRSPARRRRIWLLSPACVVCAAASSPRDVVRISVSELQASMLGSYPSVQAAFDEMDAGPNNLDAALDEEPLDLGEFGRGAARLQPPLSQAQAEHAFRALDVNRDAVVTKAELLAAVRHGDYVQSTTSTTATTTTAPTTSTRTQAPTSTRTFIFAPTTTAPDLPPPQIFHYAPFVADDLPDHPSDKQLVDVFWRRFSEETGFSLIWQQWPECDFSLLDPSRDNSSVPEEFIKATSHFKKPFEKAQAQRIFYQLDTNHNVRIEAKEFLSAIRDRHDGSKQPPLITHAEYIAGLRTAGGSAGLTLEIDRLDVFKLSPFLQHSIQRIVALNVAETADISTDWVKSLDGEKGSVTLSDLNGAVAMLASRRLLGDTFSQLEACVKLRPGMRPEDLLAAVQTGSGRLAADLSLVPSIRESHAGALTADALRYGLFDSPMTSFWVADIDGDGRLSRTEFTAAALEFNFSKPLTPQQVVYAFGGLDADYDGKLSLSEYSGDAAGGRFVSQPFNGRQIAMEDFKARMASAYWSPQEAFEAMLEDPADLNQFTKVVQTFRPPLTGEQAEFAFQGLDADKDGLLVNTEFLEVLRFNSFFPKLQELKVMLSAITGRRWFEGFEAESESHKDTCSFAWAVAGLFFLGLFGRSIALALRLPAAVGVALAGALAFRYGFVPKELTAGGLKLQDHFAEAAHFLFLFATGLNLSVSDLRIPVLTMATLPATLEFAAIATYAVMAMQMSIPHAVLLGLVLFGVGDGAVVARMHELCAGRSFGHPALRLATLWAPTEACFALLLWGASSGLIAESFGPNPDYFTLLFVGSVRVAMTAAAGAAVGYVAGILLSVRCKAEFLGRTVFTNAPEEAAMLALATAALGYCLAALSTDGWMDLFGLGAHPSLEPTIMALSIGATLSRTMSSKDLEAVDGGVGGLWTAGQLVLFILFGSEMGTFSFSGILQVLPLMGLGLAGRLLGFLFVATTSPTVCTCEQCRTASKSSVCTDAALYFIASLHRTTLQAFLGTPRCLGPAFGGGHAGSVAAEFTVLAAQCYFLLLSTAGSLLLHIAGPALLAPARRCEAAVALEEKLAAEGWTARQRMMSGGAVVLPRKFFRIGLLSEHGAVIESLACPALTLKETVMKLAKAYNVDARIFATLVGNHAVGNFDDEDAAPESHLLGSSVPAGYASVRQMNMRAGEQGNGAAAPTGRSGASALSSESGRSGGTDLSSGGVLAYMKSKTSVRRLAQERLLPPRACFEADGCAVMSGHHGGTGTPVRL